MNARNIWNLETATELMARNGPKQDALQLRAAAWRSIRFQSTVMQSIFWQLDGDLRLLVMKVLGSTVENFGPAGARRAIESNPSVEVVNVCPVQHGVFSSLHSCEAAVKTLHACIACVYCVDDSYRCR